MIKHFIAISSIYSRGERIAWHYADEKLNSKKIEEFLNSLKKKHGDIQLGIHKISTESADWNSVIEADSYFKDLIVVKQYEDFIKLIGREQQLTALDIAKYILTITPMSHLKLQKLIYLVYEDFLKFTGVRLFNDEIYAWKHGPVIESVYDVFKVHGSSLIPYEEDDNVLIYTSDLTVSPSFMRIISTEHGKLALNTTHEILKKYLHLNAWDLVELTHQDGKPWKKVYKSGMNKLIPDEIILSYS